MYSKNPLGLGIYTGYGSDESESFEDLLVKLEEWGFHVQNIFRCNGLLCLKIKNLGSYKVRFYKTDNHIKSRLKLYK